jgi:hypothetical protein
LAGRVEKIENRVLGTEDKVEELDQTVKEQENMNGTCKTTGHHEKTKPTNHG